MDTDKIADIIKMNFILILVQQPLFRLLGAILVLLITDLKPIYGLIAGLVWILWVYVGSGSGSGSGSSSFFIDRK